MNNYRFILDPKSKKFLCPECSKRTFVKYFDSTAGEYLPDNYGRCDREIKCNYDLNPYKARYSKMIWEEESEAGANFQRKQLAPDRAQPKQEIKIHSFIPYKILAATRKGYEQNTFIQNLLHRVKFPFDEEKIKQVIGIYHLGTICKGYRAGAITFPFIDIKGNIRAIQAKQFDETNHTKSTDFLHSIYKRACEDENKQLPGWLKIYLENDTKVSCLFAEHLLTKYQRNPIALVEAPKNAIIGALYFGFPDNPKNFLWLAVYNLSSLSLEKCKVLEGREVVLFPDLSAYDKWSGKAIQFQKEMPGTTFKVSDLLETFATNESKMEGEDIADYLSRLDWREFKESQKKERPIFFKDHYSKEKIFINPEKVEDFGNKKDDPKPMIIEDWQPELIKLEKFFKSVSLPAMVQLNKAAKITNLPLFIDTHFQTLNRSNGNKRFVTYLDRLRDLKKCLDHA